MTDETYNGWRNYATWRVQLELVDEWIGQLDGEESNSWLKLSTFAIADIIKDYVDDSITGYGQFSEGVALDYARAFVSDVDWYELAEHAQDRLLEIVEVMNFEVES